jgi:aminoglycoside phosphotransferase (APT) family kinase protein
VDNPQEPVRLNTSTPWKPELEVTPALAQQLITRQFPELCPVTVRYLSAGWDNTVYEVNDQWLFRFPHRQLAAPLIHTEIALLKALAPRLPIAIPEPGWIGHPEAHYPWTFAGYRPISGETACRLHLSPQERMPWASPLGHFLHSLHSQSHAWSKAHGIQSDQLQRMDIPKRQRMIHEQLAEIQAAGIISSVQPWQHLLAEVPLEPESLTLVHGDLYARHLIGTPEREFGGVIDWGDVHWGDPAQDLRIAWSFLPPEAYPAFEKAYGPISAHTAARARLSALFSTTAVLRYGLHIGDTDLLREGQQSLQWLAHMGNVHAH